MVISSDKLNGGGKVGVRSVLPFVKLKTKSEPRKDFFERLNFR